MKGAVTCADSTGTVVAVAVTAAVVAGIYLVGSPMPTSARAGSTSAGCRTCRAIARAIDLYWTRQVAGLPASLEQLRTGHRCECHRSPIR